MVRMSSMADVIGPNVPCRMPHERLRLQHDCVTLPLVLIGQTRRETRLKRQALPSLGKSVRTRQLVCRLHHALGIVCCP